MYHEAIPGKIASQLDEFWLALANAKIEDVITYLQRAGYQSTTAALRDLRADILECAGDLRDRHEIEAAVQLEKLAEDVDYFLQRL